MSREVDVVVHVTEILIAEARCSAAEVTYELPLGHLVLDVWTGEVHAQEDQGVADEVDGIYKGDGGGGWGGQ